MHWAQNLDVTLFHWINSGWSNSFFDVLMPFVSGNRFFLPAALVAAVLLLWKGGARGRVFVLMLVLAVALGDPLVINTLKQLLHRPRPFLALSDVNVPPGVGRTDTGSMPSAHSANCFAMAMIAFIYFRRSIWFMLPVAALVGLSRIYNGVHYPSDVLAGAILGSGYAACGVWTLDAFWRCAGPRWFPIWWRRLPSLLNPIVRPAPADDKTETGLLDQHWLRLGFVLVVLQLMGNLAYNASGTITLSGDEAYQWIWSKHLALSYYSKPPMIALLQFAGTSLWGDTVFGVRFFSPVITALTALALLRFLARVANVRVAFWLSVILPATPMLAVGSVLMTIDPPSVMFWTLAMIAGWRAIQDDSTVVDWLWVGLWMGLGFLSKYTALFQLLSWAVLFAIYSPARKQLRRPGFYLALLVNFLCSIPVLIWNSQHGWVTVQHVSDNAQLDHPWQFTPANLWHGFSHYTTEFMLVETLLQNPFFFLPAIWAAFAFWHRGRHRALSVYFFSMGAPLFLCYFLWTFHSRVYPNWIAPSILPLLCLAAVYWDEKWAAGFRHVKTWLFSGLILGGLGVAILHDTRLISKFTGGLVEIPADKDSTRRVKGWAETTAVVEAARQTLLAEGEPTFIIGGHYAITGEVTFNLPAARIGLPDHPLVYYQSSTVPKNQFFFWPGYKDRKGENAIYIPEELELSGTNTPPIPEILRNEFTSITDLGPVTVFSQGLPVHRIEIIECRGLR